MSTFQLVKGIVCCKRISYVFYRNSIRMFTYRSHISHSQNKFQLTGLQSARFLKLLNPQVLRNYQTKSNDLNKEEDEPTEPGIKVKNVLDDLEFQGILKDFSRDFDVNEETKKVLEEIKQSNTESTTENATSRSQKATSRSDHKLNLEKDTMLENVIIPSAPRYGEFHDHDSQVILSHEEIINDQESEKFFHIDQEWKKSTKIVGERGKEGVFDISELVELLKENNLIDISVIRIPPEFHYADYMVLTTAKSHRQCLAVVELVRKCYKAKKNERDPFFRREGRKVTPWRVLDIGNIVLHLFLPDTRSFYDIESLWVLDRKYDIADAPKDYPQIDMMQEHIDFLTKLLPQ